MKIGYARVSTEDQNPDLQLAALKQAGCQRVVTDKATGTHVKRPELTRRLKALNEGDTLTVWKLDRLGRSATVARGVKMGRKPKLSPQQIAHARKLVEQGERHDTVVHSLNVSRRTLYRALQEAWPTTAHRRWTHDKFSCKICRYNKT